MIKQSKSLRDSLRYLKNGWVKQYFALRINASNQPLTVWGRRHPYRILLILSHMRSGSSLLTHLLNANPEIIGYGETHLTYAALDDFAPLINRAYYRTLEFRRWQDIKNLRMSHNYVMDKLLHDSKLADPNLLQNGQINGIFLLREPARSLPSLLALKPHWHEENALQYYCDRLETLVDYAQRIDSPERAMVLTYDEILDNTPACLGALQSFLRTEAPFSEEYGILKTTGQKGVGDSQGYIKTGKIVRQQRPIEQTLSPQILEKAEATYGTVKAHLSQLCHTVR